MLPLLPEPATADRRSAARNFTFKLEFGNKNAKTISTLARQLNAFLTEDQTWPLSLIYFALLKEHWNMHNIIYFRVSILLIALKIFQFTVKSWYPNLRSAHYHHNRL